ncbi:MAG: DUF2238 domain-containing protein [Candidatus Pacearchaeota archaeon]
MELKKGQLAILLINLFLVTIFSFLAFKKSNYEFIFYILIIIILLILVLVTNKKNNLSNFVLWGLTGWAFLHMFGGIIRIDGVIVYGHVLLKIIETQNFTILRYDQLVHAYGFGIATIVGYGLLKPNLKQKVNWKVLSFMLVFIGMGLGVVNELVEFMAVLALPETGVGGYYNTLFDLTFNTIGSIIAVIIINLKKDL